MSAPSSERRLLRPRYTRFAAGRLWVIDETQPVAALLEPTSGQIDRIVSWPEIPSPSPALTIASHADRVWLQYRGTDVLSCVTVDGVHHAEYLEGSHLLTAGSSGAWCFRPTRTRDDVARTADEPPLPRPRSRPPLLLAHPGGGTSPIDVDGVLVAADFDEQSVHLAVEHTPWSRTYRGTPTPAGYVLQQSKSWIHLPLDASTTRIELDDYPRSRADGAWHTSEYTDITYNELHRRKRAIGDGVRWHWGVTGRHGGVLIAKAFRAGSSTPVCEIELPEVRAYEGTAYGDQLWLLVRSVDGASRHLVRLSIDTAESELDTAIDDLDITGYCRPVAPAPPDHASYVRYCIRRLDGRRFSKRMHDVRGEFIGDWPHGRLHISFTHDDYEGLTVVTRLNLYDEQGRRLDDITCYAPTELMEQADTRAYPDRSRAVGGVLYV
ncbi:hypothetical protein CH252_28920 [Rhodococcus sp. 06-1477-1B]|nr:hypothetical protein CH252_28920 [Rhodococcus sp. 06-1477-1B]OZD50823.1 hypothetical protein CH266_14155 [Rhodococcus sp. 06-1474-1B]